MVSQDDDTTVSRANTPKQGINIIGRCGPWSKKLTSTLSGSSVKVVEAYRNSAMLNNDDGDLYLKKDASLVIILIMNTLLQASFFVIVSSSSAYAQHLGGSTTFSGLVIGIPTFFSGLALIPLMRLDKGGYVLPLHFACGSMVLGSALYGLAYKTKFLYLILIGRIVQGFGFSFWMYCKRYCSDPRVVGIRRRTTLASWLVLGIGLGLSAGPFFGGLMYKFGFHSEIFNGYTAPGWIMASIWLVFWAACAYFFKDVSPVERTQNVELTTSDTGALPAPITLRSRIRHLGLRQWGVVVTMCWFAMTCFFILGAWEANIPVFASAPRITLSKYPLSPFQWSPFASGNFIALGGICIFPFLYLNVLFAKRIQDRHILALGFGLGLVGLLTALTLLRLQPAHGSLTYGGFFVCWFFVALGFSLASTCTLSLLSKQLPASWNGWTSLAIQYSNYVGRVTGAVWGGAGVHVGELNYIGLEIALIGIGGMMFLTLWRELKAKTG